MNDRGKRTIPSYVAFTGTERLFGHAAINRMTMNPQNTVFNVKWMIGRKFDDATVQSAMKHWPFKIVRSGGKPNIEVECQGEMRTFCPQVISAMVLWKMKGTAEAYLGKTITDAVITVRACFDHSRKETTRDAGVIAELDVLRIIDESTAAAIAFGIHNGVGGQRTIMIFDLGV